MDCEAELYLSKAINAAVECCDCIVNVLSPHRIQVHLHCKPLSLSEVIAPDSSYHGVPFAEAVMSYALVPANETLKNAEAFTPEYGFVPENYSCPALFRLSDISESFALHIVKSYEIVASFGTTGDELQPEFELGWCMSICFRSELNIGVLGFLLRDKAQLNSFSAAIHFKQFDTPYALKTFPLN